MTHFTRDVREHNYGGISQFRERFLCQIETETIAVCRNFPRYPNKVNLSCLLHLLEMRRIVSLQTLTYGN